MREHPRDLVHARGDVDRFEDLLLFLGLDVHVGSGEVGERRRSLDRLDRGKKVSRHLRQELDRFDGLRLQIDETGFDFGRARLRFWNPQHAGNHKGPAGQIFDDLESLLALADQMMRSVRGRDVAHDIGERAHAMHVDRGRIFNV